MNDFKPSQHHALTPFLLVKDASEFIDFLKDAFDAEPIMDHREDGRVVHAEMKVLGTVVELGEPRGDFSPTHSAFHCFVPDVDATYAHLVEMGCEPVYEVSDQEYGERSGGVEDRWGNQWYIATVTDPARRGS